MIIIFMMNDLNIQQGFRMHESSNHPCPINVTDKEEKTEDINEPWTLISLSSNDLKNMEKKVQQTTTTTEAVFRNPNPPLDKYLAGDSLTIASIDSSWFT